ncbi:MAG TPA: hypothetical protein DDZ51_00845 [Planctomycetaceae bacterium]|nr:hypothetical protein [Planctomycetaceae bacterium]
MTGQISIFRPAKNRWESIFNSLQIEDPIAINSAPVIIIKTTVCQAGEVRHCERQMVDLAIDLTERSVVISGVPCQARLLER